MKSTTVLSTLLAFAGIGGYAHAGTFQFNFNALTGYGNNSGNQAVSIAAQLTTQLHTVCPTCTITATSSTNGADAIIDKTYTGEGHVVGPTSGANNTGSVMPETLGDIPNNTAITSNSQYTYAQLLANGYNTQFLSNTNDSSGQNFCGTGTSACSEISFQFSGLTITGASFNYEAFPSNSGAGFEFEAGMGTHGTDSMVFTKGGLTPSSSGADGSSTRSQSANPEGNAQYIGSWSGTFGGSTELDFLDWPPTIGISDLMITYSLPPAVPEPTSVLLLATACVGLLLSLRRKFSQLS